MDPSLVEYLDRRFEENREELREFRLEISRRFDGNRGELQELGLDTSRRFDENREELQELRLDTSKRFDETSTRFDETSQRFDHLESELGQVRVLATEIRHLHVLVEEQKTGLQTVTEGVASNDQKITRLRTEMNGQFEDLKGLLYPPSAVPGNSIQSVTTL